MQEKSDKNGTTLKPSANDVQHLDVENIYMCFHFWSFPQMFGILKTQVLITSTE